MIIKRLCIFFYKDETERCCRNDSKSLYLTTNYLLGSEQELIYPYHENKLTNKMVHYYADKISIIRNEI